MNYHRIYSEFILSRRNRESGITGYYEAHHIVPVSLGGSNSKDNIINLSAADHYFAHLCLAKMHGGKMWAAVWAIAGMIQSRDRSVAFKSRKLVSVARTQMGIHMSHQRKGVPKPKVRGERNGMNMPGARQKHAEVMRTDRYKKTISDAQKRVWEREDIKSSRQKKFVEAWADPVKSAKRRATYSCEEFKNSQSAKMKAIWSDPLFREKQLLNRREKIALKRALLGSEDIRGTGA